MAQLSLVNREPDYTDIDLDFFKDPTTKDLIKKTGDDAIKRSIRNLVFTNFYDRPFQPYIGSHIRKVLFDPISPMTKILLQNAISQVINNFERRVKLLSVDVSEDIDNNGYNVRLQYVILNRNLPITTNMFLERIR